MEKKKDFTDHKHSRENEKLYFRLFNIYLNSIKVPITLTCT